MPISADLPPNAVFLTIPRLIRGKTSEATLGKTH